MADTNFVSKVTKIPTDWANDVNKLRYGTGDGLRGAALLEFLQSGAGTVPRKVQDKERDIVSVKDFKNDNGNQVKGDGVEDETTGIVAALTEIQNNSRGGLYFPPGTYLTGEQTMPGNNIAIIGAGSGYAYNTSATPRTIFKAKAGTTNVWNLVVTGTAEDRTNCLLTGFQVDGNSIAANGIKCAGANLIHRVSAKGCTNAGILLDNFTN